MCCCMEMIFVVVGVVVLLVVEIGSCEVICEVILYGVGGSLFLFGEVECYLDLCVIVLCGVDMMIDEYVYYLKVCCQSFVIDVFFVCILLGDGEVVDVIDVVDMVEIG